MVSDCEVKQCVDCKEEKYVVVMTEIEIDKYICDDCLNKREDIKQS